MEPPYRGRGLAGALLQTVCREMQALGEPTLYLLTDHTRFYERYGWQYLCMVQADGDPRALPGVCAYRKLKKGLRQFTGAALQRVEKLDTLQRGQQPRTAIA